ncbi:MAG: O-antigen ligase family protein [Candidatus Omnitrophota bacterium]|nr:O-antigen ligase family protein [Candidatus Omnitrophota bacterium]
MATTAPLQIFPDKENIKTYFLMGIIATIFAYIVLKEVSLPSYVLISAGLIGGIILIVQGISKPHVITYVLVAYLPFSRILVGDFSGAAQSLNMTNVLMIFIIVAWISGKYAEGEPPWLSSPLNGLIFMFMVFGLVAVYRGVTHSSANYWDVLTQYKRWITPLILYFLVLNTVKDKKTIRNIIGIMIIVTTLVGLMAIYDYIEIGEVSTLEKSRVGGIAEHSNSLAAFFCYYMFLPFGFFLMNMHRPKYWLLLVPFLIQFRGIMVTFSRGGYLAFALGLYAAAWFRSKFLFIVLLGLTGLAVLNPIILPAGIRYRMMQTINKDVSYIETAEELEGSLETSSKTRVEVWKGAVKMIAEYPMLGVGYGLFYYRISPYWEQNRPIDAHNSYIIIAAEMGIPALLNFLLIVLVTIWMAYSLYARTKDPFSKAVALGYLGGLFGLLMSNMFGSRLDHLEVAGYFWILAALVQRLRIIDGREAAAPPTEDESRAGGPAAVKRSNKLDACWSEAD